MPSENAPSTTTGEEDRETAGLRNAQILKTQGQRKVNLLWETVQGTIAIMISSAMIYADIAGIKADNLATAFTLIIAIYFVRMNHTKIGGVGGSDTR